MAASFSLLTAGCSTEAVDQWRRGGLPEGVTNQTDRVTTLWQGSWFTLLVVGALVWGLIIFSVIAFRRRATDTGLPPQVRYNVPIETLYTALPIIMVLVFFYFTARDENSLVNVSGEADHTVNVVAKRWSWDFNYTDADVYETGTPGVPPTLYLPEGESVEFVLTSRDVAHSFWVPAFLFKMDHIPGKINRFEVTPTQQGEFFGKCAELCGVDHSRMLFNVRVVSPQDYEAHVQELRDRGQTGELPAEIGPDLEVDQGPSANQQQRGRT
jgi:cytochrome c oxidase subunit II